MGAQWLRGSNKIVGGIGSSGFAVTITSTSTAQAANTLDLTLQDGNGFAVDPQPDALYVVSIINASTISQLSVTALNKHLSFGGADNFSKLTNWTVAAASAATEIDDFLVQGLFVGEAARLSFFPASSAPNFTATVRVTKV